MITAKKILMAVVITLCTATLFAQQTVVVTKETPNGREELRYNENKELDGRCLTWNQEGMLVGLAEYRDGEKHGVWKVWYDNGQLAYKIRYKNGEKHGTWKHWDKDGNLVVQRKYE